VGKAKVLTFMDQQGADPFVSLCTIWLTKLNKRKDVTVIDKDRVKKSKKDSGDEENKHNTQKRLINNGKSDKISVESNEGDNEVEDGAIDLGG
jgi:hypothetical protein